jgi:hypothetical protein
MMKNLDFTTLDDVFDCNLLQLGGKFNFACLWLHYKTTFLKKYYISDRKSECIFDASPPKLLFGSRVFVAISGNIS